MARQREWETTRSHALRAKAMEAEWEQVSNIPRKTVNRSQVADFHARMLDAVADAEERRELKRLELEAEYSVHDGRRLNARQFLARQEERQREMQMRLEEKNNDGNAANNDETVDVDVDTALGQERRRTHGRAGCGPRP